MKQLLILSGKGGTGKTTVAGAFIFLSKAKANAETVASLADKDRENEAAIQKRIAEAVNSIKESGILN